MWTRQHNIALVALAIASAGACRRASPPRASAPRAAPPPSPSPAPPAPRAWDVEAPLDGVVDPWTWQRAQGSKAHEKAIEDIGPYEHGINTNAHYWTALARIAWDRDVDIDLDNEPVDLDGDGRPDTKVTRHVHAKGGILAHPSLFGLTPTPDDPRGTVGRISASTGVLGLREALTEDGKPTGEIGMTCWLCHGQTPSEDKQPVLGLPGVAFDYGLLLATAGVLDDADAGAVAYRRAHGYPSGRAVRARLVLAGPGRQDLTGEFGLDVTVPGYHSARYPGTARVRQGTRGLVNPISVPGIWAAPGLAVENWSGSEDAKAPWLERLVALAGEPEREVLERFALPTRDRAAARRALLFDLRNLGTLGLQHDSFPGLLWSDAIYGRAQLSPGATAAVHAMYAAPAVREAAEGAMHRRAMAQRVKRMHLILQSRTPQRVGPVNSPREWVDVRVLRGRAIFAERFVGEIANRQILRHAPARYAVAKLAGPVLAPIDPTKPLDAKLQVRCADCHAAAPLERKRPLAENPPPFGRCTHCHHAHVRLEHDAAFRGLGGRSFDPELLPATPLDGPDAAGEVAFCARCHSQHRDFGLVVYSSSLLFPFDADGDGDAQGDPDADRRAGGIGTDPWLAFDVPRTEWPFTIEMPVIGAVRGGRITRARLGVSWVRAAPLVALSASAPYLHNGSVPTLATLLEPAARRPDTFPLGKAGFVLDTRLPGNGNQGHEFGTRLSPSEKADLVAFLESL